MLFSCCSFFFQAEDGIRDIGVTGVQTCALPISQYDRDGLWNQSCLRDTRGGDRRSERRRSARSEERRVGKECRSRWRPNYQKKKDNHRNRGRTRKTVRVGGEVGDVASGRRAAAE